MTTITAREGRTPTIGIGRKIHRFAFPVGL
jgi:hypothetical protein